MSSDVQPKRSHTFIREWTVASRSVNFNFFVLQLGSFALLPKEELKYALIVHVVA